MKLLPAGERHLDAVLAIENAVFPDPWTRGIFLTELDNPISVFLVCESDQGEVVGYVAGQNVAGEFTVDNIAVLPASRREGIGTVLLSAALGIARRLGCVSATLEVRVSNLPARRLYESFGFEFMGVRPGYYETPKEDAAVYTLIFDSETEETL